MREGEKEQQFLDFQRSFSHCLVGRIPFLDVHTRESDFLWTEEKQQRKEKTQRI